MSLSASDHGVKKQFVNILSICDWLSFQNYAQFVLKWSFKNLLTIPEGKLDPRSSNHLIG